MTVLCSLLNRIHPSKFTASDPRSTYIGTYHVTFQRTVSNKGASKPLTSTYTEAITVKKATKANQLQLISQATCVIATLEGNSLTIAPTATDSTYSSGILEGSGTFCHRWLYLRVAVQSELSEKTSIGAGPRRQGLLKSLLTHLSLD